VGARSGCAECREALRVWALRWGSGRAVEEESGRGKHCLTKLRIMPQHNATAAQNSVLSIHSLHSLHSAVPPHQPISAADKAELKQWFAKNGFPQQVLEHLLLLPGDSQFITDIQDLAQIHEDTLHASGLPHAEFGRFYDLVRTDRAVTRLCPEGHNLDVVVVVVNGLPSNYSRRGWECNLCGSLLERDASKVLHCAQTPTLIRSTSCL
jgi:hypothetical protein